MKVLFISNIPSPYRVDFFNELAKYVELTVLYQRHTSLERDAKWKSKSNSFYTQIFLKGKNIGVDSAICPGVVRYLKRNKFDKIVICGINSPTVILAIFWCKLFKIPYYLEIDGGFHKNGKGIKEKIKHFEISGAYGYLSTSKTGDDYFTFYGADRLRIHRYPFTSVYEKDLLVATPTNDEKLYHKEQLGIKESRAVLSVWRSSYTAGYGEGYNLLMKIAFAMKEEDVGFFIVGEEPASGFMNIEEQYNISNVHFIDVKNKDELEAYYRAADAFILLACAADCGLLINESMANALPVIVSDTNSSLEMIRNGKNGYIVPSYDWKTSLERLRRILTNESFCTIMSATALETALKYTVNNPTREIVKVFKAGSTAYKEFLRNKWNIEQSKFVFLAIGQFIPRKGFDLLLQEACNFRECMFLFVGGKPTEEYMSIVEDNKLDNVKFYPFVVREEVAEFYSLADCFVLPTREDVWGLVVNEALAHGLPVITTDKCIAGTEMIKNGFNGFIVNSDRPDELSRAMCDILETTAKGNDIYSYWAFMVAKQFTIEKMCESHVAILNL